MWAPWPRLGGGINCDTASVLVAGAGGVPGWVSLSVRGSSIKAAMVAGVAGVIVAQMVAWCWSWR